MNSKEKLELINKMARLRKGNIPVPVIVLYGSKENIETIAKEESEILGSYFAILKKDGNINAGKVYFVPRDESKETDLSWLPKKYETIEVNDLCFNWALFFESLGLDNVSKDMFSDLDKDDVTILKTYYSDILQEVLYKHYELCDNNNFNENDLKTIKEQISFHRNTKPSAAKAPVESVKPVSEKQEKKPEKQDLPKKKIFSNSTIIGAPVKKDPIKPEEPIKKETKEETQEEIQEESNLGLVSEVTPEEKESTEITMSEPMIPEENKAVNEAIEDENGLVVPKLIEPQKKTYTYKVKEELTDEEIAYNEELLNDLHAMYQSTIAFMKDTCNSKYRVLINKMQEVLDKDIYKIQFTKEYLLENDDTSSELYRKLYDLDVATQEFHKNVVHQIKHIACFSCNTEWDEDITFLKKGYHSVRCPKCYSNYPFEK